MTYSTDTIVAQATPPGHGGVAIVRISGPAVQTISFALAGIQLDPRKATYLPFQDNDGSAIDHGLLIFFPNPHSFTGEDVLELHGHGGPVVVDLLIQRILNLGARLARPGEFSERAFLNGKLDLTQAEAVADLIHASSKEAARSAVRSLQGTFSKHIRDLNERLIHVRMFIEAAIDFTDEEIDFLSDEKITQQLETILDEIIQIQSIAKQGSLLREGISVVIVGEPNVGKSSLLNALSGKDTAIVTNIPGTTRDVLREHIIIDGLPLHIIDTAGLRESLDVVEQEGIKRAKNELTKADLVLYVEDITKENNQSLWIELSRFDCPKICIKNKIDLVKLEPTIKNEHDKTELYISAETELGIDLLKQYIKSIVGFKNETEGLFLARRRHLDALARAQIQVEHSLAQLKTSRLGELAAEDLRQAQRALSEITGEFSADDLLGKIFSSFCIGK